MRVYGYTCQACGRRQRTADARRCQGGGLTVRCQGCGEVERIEPVGSPLSGGGCRV